MYIVAITRWGTAPEQEAVALAPELGLVVYDLRLKLMGPLPIVISAQLEYQEAVELLGRLQGRGHGAVLCDEATVPRGSGIITPRSFEFDETAFIGLGPAGERYPFAYADIIGLVRAACITAEQSVVISETKKFNLNRALMSGGLVNHEKVVKVEKSEQSNRQRALYIFQRSGPEPMLLMEQSLHYDGLGSHRQPTVHQNFATTVSWLHQHSGAAFYDERLATQKRKTDMAGVTGTAKDQTIASSNASANDLAAFLLMHGHLQGQL